MKNSLRLQVVRLQQGKNIFVDCFATVIEGGFVQVPELNPSFC